MALPSSYQGHRVHSVLNIAQSFNALNPHWIHIKQVCLSGLFFFLSLCFYIQGREVASGVCVCASVSVSPWTGCWLISSNRKEGKSEDHGMWASICWSHLNRAFVSKPVKPGMLGGDIDLRDGGEKVRGATIHLLLKGWWERSILMCLLQRNLHKQDKRLPETSKLWLFLSSRAASFMQKRSVKSSSQTLKRHSDLTYMNLKPMCCSLITGSSPFGK